MEFFGLYALHSSYFASYSIYVIHIVSERENFLSLQFLLRFLLLYFSHFGAYTFLSVLEDFSFSAGSS